MADRVLPSPKEINDAYVNDPDSSRLREWAWDCLVARMEGRLVDREAIDYRWIIEDETYDWPKWKIDHIVERIDEALGTSDG